MPFLMPFDCHHGLIDNLLMLMESAGSDQLIITVASHELEAPLQDSGPKLKACHRFAVCTLIFCVK